MNTLKTKALILILLFLSLIFSCTRSTQSEVIRVACVGNSITYGSGIQDREHRSYPAQLGKMLGEGYDVRNFGVSGATMLKKGDKPYWKQEVFQQALNFRPHIVIIQLGTNDSKPQNWQYRDEYKKDYLDMVDRFLIQEPQPKIFLCLPVPAFEVRWGICPEDLEEEVIPIVKEVAAQRNLPIIDLFTPFKGKEELFPDKIHPNAEGAKLMAEVIYQMITGKKAPLTSN